MSEQNSSAFVSGVCPRCGAPIDVNPLLEAGVCQYCGTPYTTKSAIRSVSIVNNTVNHIHNSNDTYNVQYGKKGAIQSTLEFIDKRVEAREKALAEEREQERIRQERDRLRREQAAARSKRIWRGIGQFFLWIYGFPIMLAIVILKRVQENKENEKRLSYGYEPKPLTPLPIAFIVVGALFFLMIIGAMIRGNGPDKTTSSTTASTASQSAQTQPASQSHWYDRTPTHIKEISFTQETKTVSRGMFQFEVPSDWQDKYGGDDVYFYPLDSADAIVYLAHIEEFENYNFEEMTNEQLLPILDAFLTSTAKSDGVSSASAMPLWLNNKLIAYFESEYENQSIAGAKKLVLFAIPSNNQILSIMAISKNKDIEATRDDLCSIVNSLSLQD